MKNSIKLFLMVFLLSPSLFFNSEIIAQKLAPKEFKQKLLKSKGILIDVRTSDEFVKGHIDGAINYNVISGEFKSAIKGLDKNSEYFLYCGIGTRSAMAKSIMKDAGFQKVDELNGGITEWIKQGLPIKK